jgi:hypothetical protein
MKTIIITQPHGEQSLSRIDCADSIGNSLFTLKNSDGHAITMTGEELDSLANQWLEWRDTGKEFSVTYEYTDVHGRSRSNRAVITGRTKPEAIRDFKKHNPHLRKVRSV